jgi:hypothetical protein
MTIIICREFEGASFNSKAYATGQPIRAVRDWQNHKGPWHGNPRFAKQFTDEAAAQAFRASLPLPKNCKSYCIGLEYVIED